jgi:apolipoprotein D and lipocalin family protein
MNTPSALRRLLTVSVITLGSLCLPALALAMGGSKLPPLKTVAKVEIETFMGDWNVLANLPTSTEAGCHNALEQYALKDDGDVAITFSCSKGSFDAPREVNHFTGIIQNPGTNTEWRVAMKFLGFIPLKLPYLVIDLAPDGSYTVIGYPSREYVWVMARGKSLPDETWSGIYARLKEQGYDTDKIQRVPIR